MSATGRSAAEIADMVRSGDIAAADVVAAHLAAMESAAELNAFTLVEAGPAQERAAEIDRMIADGDDPGPLAGVPVVLKDIIDHKGRPTTAGSSFLRQPAAATAPAVGRLEAAGAVVVGRTGLHEFAYGFTSENDWWGPVRNPWDTATSPGGSSGGSGAAVAAGLAPIGIGTDTGGSVRVPAALCGCVGLKVTHGRIPLTGVFPLAPSLDTVGPITRSVSDAALAYEVMAGFDRDDPWSAPRPVEPTEQVLPRDLRITVAHPWADRPLHPVQQEGLEAALGALTAAGAVVEHLSDDRIDAALLPRGAYAEVAAVHRRWFEEGPERYGPGIRERVAATLDLTTDDLAAALVWRAGLRHAFLGALESADLLLTPAVALHTKVIGSDEVAAGAGPEPHRPTLSWFTVLVNQAGLPAITLPLGGLGDHPGPPAAIQLIGPWWGEGRLLGAARALEELGMVGYLPPPARKDSP